MKLDILAFGAHPDDVELGCGASIAKAVAQGKQVGIIDLTQGEMGTRGTAELRASESKVAADILGVRIRENLNFKDAFIFNDSDHQMEVIRVLRKYTPDVVLCNAVKDRHTDHAKASDLVSHASFLSGLQRIETFDDQEVAIKWLKEPCTAIGNIKPLDYLTNSSGMEMVLDELGRIEHGIFA